jgi:hypothetical protein
VLARGRRRPHGLRRTTPRRSRSTNTRVTTERVTAARITAAPTASSSTRSSWRRCSDGSSCSANRGSVRVERRHLPVA